MYTMRQAAKLAGMNYETLRFYCKEGLVPNVKRDKNNYRIFDDHNIVWLKSLECFKQSGMGISELRHFMNLSIEGKETLLERMDILQNKKQDLYEEIEKIKRNIDYIDHKLELYQDLLEGKEKDVHFLASEE